jgi:hypothetical protein
VLQVGAAKQLRAQAAYFFSTTMLKVHANGHFV